MRERGFVVEVTAFLPAGETDVAAMSDAAGRIQQLTEWLHELGFSAVAVTSKFTSRKVEAPDLALPTGDGGYRGHQVSPQELLDKHKADILNNGFTQVSGSVPHGITGGPTTTAGNGLTAEEERELDLPRDLARTKSSAG